MQLPAFFHKKPVLLALGIVVLLLYIGFNVWLFRTSQKNPSVTSQGTNKASSQTTSGFSHDLFGKPGNQATSTGQAAPTPTPPLATPTPTPTPTPRPTGPGRYACDPNGICGDYGDKQRQSCPATFADRLCLDQCGNKSNLCSQ